MPFNISRSLPISSFVFTLTNAYATVCNVSASLILGRMQNVCFVICSGSILPLVLGWLFPFPNGNWFLDIKASLPLLNSNQHQHQTPLLLLLAGLFHPSNVAIGIALAYTERKAQFLLSFIQQKQHQRRVMYCFCCWIHFAFHWMERDWAKRS